MPQYICEPVARLGRLAYLKHCDTVGEPPRDSGGGHGYLLKRDIEGRSDLRVCPLLTSTLPPWPLEGVTASGRRLPRHRESGRACCSSPSSTFEWTVGHAPPVRQPAKRTLLPLWYLPAGSGGKLWGILSGIQSTGARLTLGACPIVKGSGSGESRRANASMLSRSHSSSCAQPIPLSKHGVLF